MKHTLLTLACCMAFIMNSYAAIVTWDGGGADTNWFNPLNWDTDALPTTADEVYIEDDDVFVTAAATVQRVYLFGSATLTINPGVTLTIDGFTGNDRGMDINNSATLINDGTLIITNISGGNDASGLYVRGICTNNGDIVISNTDRHGILIQRGDLTNSAGATITVTTSGLSNNDSDNIYVDDSGGVIGNLTNDGTITLTTMSGADDGIYLNEGSTFSNNGVITISGDGDNGIRVDDDTVFDNNQGATLNISGGTDDLLYVDDTGSFNNSGVINLSDSDTGDAALYVIDDGVFTNQICGEIYITTAINYSIQIDGNSLTAEIINNGTITATGGGNDGLRMQEGGVFTNNATGILNLISSGDEGIQIDDLLSTSTFNNSGLVDIVSAAGHAMECFGAFNNLAGGIYQAKGFGSDGIRMQNFGVFSNDGEIRVDGTGDDDIEAESITSFVQTANATITVGCPGIGDLDIKDDIDFGEATVTFEISGLTPVTEFDQILNSNSANFIDISSAKMHLDWGCYVPAVGDTYKVIDGSGDVTGDFATVTSSNPAIVYTVTNLGDEIEVEVTAITPVSFTAPDDLCIDAGVQTGLGGGLPVGTLVSEPWVLENVTLADDGGVVSGYFDYAGNSDPVDWEIVVSGGNINDFPPITYTPDNSTSIFSNSTVAIFALDNTCGSGGPFPGDRQIRFSTGNDWITTGGTMVPLDVADINNNLECYSCSPFRTMLSGTVSGGTIATAVYSGPGVIDDGNGMTYSFDPAAAGVGSHTITYTLGVPGCPALEESATDDIEVFDLPTVNMSTAAGYCLDANIASSPITGGSPAGGVYSGTGVTDSGNGTSYNFDPMVAGVGTHTITYTYSDANGCVNSASSDLEIFECEFDIADPCACLDNATVFDCNAGTGGDDGQFSEIVTITGAGGAALPTGQTWTVVGATGALDANNVPATGVQSAGVPVAEDGSVTLTDNSGIYEIPFVHVDDIGYTLMIEGPFAMGSAANVTLTISNKCQYPDPEFDPMVPLVIKDTDPAITLGAMDTNSGSEDLVTFTLDGNAETEIDPSMLTLGFHTVVMTYDGADDGNGGISPDGGTTSASPGCIQEVTKTFEIIECELVVDCSNITDQTLACRADLPPVDFTLPIIVDSCGVISPSALTIIPGDTGCPDDTLFITRQYFINDGVSPGVECMQTFTIISSMDPVFTTFPSDTTVLCGAIIDPGATGTAEGEGECDPANPQAIITFSDVTAPGACPQEMTITRTWTVTDRCGRSVDQDQIIMIADTIAPMMVCQDLTVELDDMGEVTVMAADADNGSTDNCGGTITFTLSTSAFTCADIGENMVMLYGTDECDNVDSCMTTITVEDNILPTAVCQDVILSLDENGEATIAGGTTSMAVGVELGSPSQLPSDVMSSVCGPVGTAAAICDCPAGFVATGIEGVESTNFGGLVGEFNIICRQLLPTGNLGATSMVSCTNGSANITTVLGPVSTTGDNVLVAAQSRIGCAVDRITVYSAPMTQVLAGNNTPNTEVGFLVGSNGGNGGALRPLRTAPANNVIVGMQTFDHQGNPNYTAGIAWRYAPIEDVLVQTATEFLIDNGSSDNCDDITLTVSQADFTCDDLIAGQASTDIVVTLIVTDAVGNMSMCEATVTLMDDTAPDITCPANINLGLDPGDCDRIVDYTVQASDNCSLVADAEGNVVVQTAGLPSGSVFEPGTTTNTFEVTDPSGNVSMCSFDVVIVEFANPITAMICNDNLNISLDQNCEAFIGADQILEGGPYGCYDNYTVEISGVVGQTIVAPGVYTVTITDPATGNNCWSEVTVEDKLVPTLECTECPPGSLSAIDLPFTGTLDADSPTWTRPFGQPATCAPSGAGVDVPYQTHEFLVVTGADSDFENVSFIQPGGAGADFFMALYEDSFDPLNPCGNMVINNDDGGVGLLSQFDVMLESGTQYILVATTFNNNGNDFGDYVIELTSDAILVDAPLECLFTCFDEEAILSGVMQVPSPVAMDNCIANLPTTYTDEVTEGAICGSKVITRTFSIISDDGTILTSCVAEYQLFAAQFSQFITPPPAIVLPCGSGTSPEEIEAFFDDPTTNDIMNPNCPLDVIENNEGTTFGYITYPTLGCDGNTHLQAVDNNMCGFFTTYSDQEIPSCGAACGTANMKVIRTWTILDWCNPDTPPFTFIQIIKSEDSDAPTIEVANDFEVSVNPWNCLGDFSLPAPTLLHDLCSADVTYTVSGPAGTTLLAPNTVSNPSDNWIVFGAPKGIVIFTYTAADCCGNTSSAELLVSINDVTPPVPVATENIILNLTTSGQLDENGVAQGFAKLFTNSVDDGSYDGCSGVKIEIAREVDGCDVRGNATFNADGHPDDGSPNPNASNYDPDGGEFVMFCCADIDQVDPVTGVAFGLVPVRMRVFDDGNMTGFYGDFVDNNGDGDVLDAGEYDNFNETWVTVRVEGKAIASIVCPPDVTLACDMDYTDSAMIGTATTLSLCGSEAVDVSFTPQLDACGIGFVIATYTVLDSSPSISCSQRITIENPYPAFDPNGIRFPRNLPTSPTGQISCDDDITYAAPTWTAGACDFIGYTEEVDTFFIEEGADNNDACFKILRRFTVIDWCVYDATNGQDGLYEGSQTIKITDDEAPVLLNCDNAMFGVDDNDDANENGNICEKIGVTLTNTASDNGDCASAWLKWQVFVDTWSDGVVEYEYSSFLPSNDSNINNDTNGNGINDRYLAPSSSDEEISILVPETIESSMFNHTVVWKVTDGCGNVASCTTTFMVVDKKAPTPYCVSLSTALMENGGVELWAIDFDLGAFDNCTEQEDLRFTFSSTPPEDDNNYDPTQNSSSMEFTDCGVVSVDVYVWDEKGNVDFCTVELSINGGDDCDPIAPECPTCVENEYTGMAVATCESRLLGGAVGAIYNIRNNENRDNGEVWLDVETIHPPNWTRGEIGQKFGIAIDSEDNIYLAATDVYGLDLSNSGVSRGQIHKCSPPLFEAIPLVDLGNTGGRLNGLGNIVYDRSNDQLIASNLEDGKIYRLSTDGTILGEYDPWLADDGESGIVTQSEQVWGLGINTLNSNTKVYFARLVEGGERAIYSITLNTNGSFSNASATVEVADVPGLLPRITDFAFSQDGSQMVITERGTERADGSHIAKTMSYSVDANGLSYDFQFFVGGFVPSNDPSMFRDGENSSGGVDFGYSSANGTVNTDCEEQQKVWATGNFMFTQTFEKAYGLEGMNAGGNQSWDAPNNEGNEYTDIFIDFDGVDGTAAKGLIGDVEIFRCGPVGNRMTIAGITVTENGNGVSDAAVLTESIAPEYPRTSMTSTDGEFAFVDNPAHIDYTVTVEKNDDHTNGVSTLDLVLIQRHIVALADLDSPYKVIAADINGDNKVSSIDVVELRKLILGVQDEFTNNTSWRFVDATQVFADISDPFPVDETRNVNDLVSDMMYEDFIAVKIGDVNATAANNVAGVTTEVRSGATMLLEVLDRAVVAGEQVEIAVSSADFKAVSGLQMTVEFNGLTFNDVAGRAIAVGANNVGVISDNVITMSWNTNTAISTTDELFVITAVATKDGKISEMIKVTDRVITPEVYTSTSLSAGSGSDFEISEIELGIRGNNGVTIVNELMQNEPNPFKQSTAISFNLATAGKATLTIRDLAGRLIRTINGEYTVGMNTISIEKSDINTVGVLYYTIESGDFSDTKKMILIE